MRNIKKERWEERKKIPKTLRANERDSQEENSMRAPAGGGVDVFGVGPSHQWTYCSAGSGRPVELQVTGQIE